MLKKIIAAFVFGIALVMGTSPAYAKRERTRASPERNKESTKEKRTKKPKKVRKIKYNDSGYRKAVLSGDYKKALGMLLSLRPQDLTIAQKMDIAMFQHYAGDFTAAAETMENASRDFDNIIGADPTELFKIHAAKSAYRGNLYEYMLIDAFNALNYYNAGDLDSAYSRLVKVGEKQRQYYSNPKIGEVIAQEISPKTEPKIIDDETYDSVSGVFYSNGVESRGFFDSIAKLDMPKKADPANDIYRTSAFADYLQIVLAAQNGSYVDDYIVNELNKIKKDDVETDSAELTNSRKGRIEVLSLTGTINQKQQDRLYLDAGLIFSAFLGPYSLGIMGILKLFGIEISLKMYYPTYVPTPKEKIIKPVKISLNDGTSKKAVLLEDFDLAVLQDVNLKARRTAARNTAAELAIKIPLLATEAAGLIATYKSMNSSSNSGMEYLIFAPAAAILAGALNNADPKADIRQSMALPSKAYCAGFTVDPGVYSVKVEYSNGKTETIENVVVKAGKPVLVESVCKW